MESLESLIKKKKESRNNLMTLIGINLLAGALPFGIAYTISSNDNPSVIYSTFSSILAMSTSFYITLDRIFEETINYNECKEKIKNHS